MIVVLVCRDCWAHVQMSCHAVGHAPIAPTPQRAQIDVHFERSQIDVHIELKNQFFM